MNVVVVAAHGLNCHWLEPYGNEWINTPAIDRLACESVLFDNHFGCDASPDAFQRQALPPELPKDVLTILVEDRKAAHTTDSSWQHVFRTEPTRFGTPGEALAAAVRDALKLCAKREEGKWLLWIETDRLLPPWDFEFETYQEYARASGGFIENRDIEKEEPIDEPPIGPCDSDDLSLWHRLHNSFAAAVTSFDSELGYLIEQFRRRGLDRSAAWVLTSGFGWPLGEHGVIGPVGSRPHVELVHLPLLVRLPEGRGAMRRVPALTQTVDLKATIAELLIEVAAPDSLVAALTGGPFKEREYCHLSLPTANGRVQGVRTKEWAFLTAGENRPARLYSKPDDIWEVNDLAGRLPDECDRLAALLEQKETT